MFNGDYSQVSTIRITCSCQILFWQRICGTSQDTDGCAEIGMQGREVTEKGIKTEIDGET